MTPATFVAAILGSVAGIAFPRLGERFLRRRRRRSDPWHRRIAEMTLHSRPSQAGKSPSLPPLRASLTPGSAVALLAAVGLVKPWGPLPPLMGLSLGLFAAALVALGSGYVEAFRQKARLRELFPDWLSFLAAAMEIGMPFAQALGVAAAAVDAPLRRTAETLAEGMARGEDPSACLLEFAQTIGTQEAHFVTGILARHERLGTPVASVLVEEEGLLSRLKAQEHKTRQGLIPYAFTASAGVLLVNAVMLFVVPRAAALLATFRLPPT